MNAATWQPRRISTRAHLTPHEQSIAADFRARIGIELAVAKAIPYQRGSLYYLPGEYVVVVVRYDDGHVAEIRASIGDAEARSLMVRDEAP